MTDVTAGDAGRAFDPRKDKGPWSEKNPDELPDWAGEGNKCVEEIDEYMIRKGHMVADKDFFERENKRFERQAWLDKQLDGAGSESDDEMTIWEKMEAFGEDAM